MVTAFLLAKSRSLLTGHGRRLRSTVAPLPYFCQVNNPVLQVFILKNFILFRMNTYKKPPGGWGLMVNQLFRRSNLCGSSPTPSAAHPLACPDTVSVTSHDSLAGRIRAAAVQRVPSV